MPEEQWMPIPGLSGYEISNQRRVRRLSRQCPPSRRYPGGRIVATRIVSTSINNGYLVAYPEGRIFYVEKSVLQLFPEMIPTLESLPGEEWKNIPRYEGVYQISNFGRVLSLPRIINDGQGKNRYVRARVRENGSDAGGYPKVELAKNGEVETLLIHRLVAIAFVPNPLNLPVVHHKDEDRLNSRADNLEWVTNEGNIRDWFDRRRVVISTDTIKRVLSASAAGKTPAEILASLPRKRKIRKPAG